MTRSQVARTLKRSIATVRRMEGNELHPWRDSKGVHRFDAGEVADVARQLRATGRRDPRYDKQLPSFVLLRRLKEAESKVEKVSPAVDQRLLTEALDLLATALEYVPPGRACRALATEAESFLMRVERDLRT